MYKDDHKSKNRAKGKPKAYDESMPTSLHDSLAKDLNSLMLGLGRTASSFGAEHSFKVRYLSTNVWSKFVEPSTEGAEERKSRAIAKWLEMEKRNEKTNHRLLFDSTRFGKLSSERLVRYARKEVSRIIGTAVPESILDGSFTNGASTRVKRGPVATAQKYLGEANVTQEAKALFETYVLRGSPLWLGALDSGSLIPTVVPGSVMFTVPKNTEIDRVACKEPEINMYMQRGVGEFFRRRLRAVCGIDLNDQTNNQRLAKQGSLKRDLATIDLSSASDLISTQLVYLLLPLDWFCLLDSIRSKTVEIDGDLHDMHMFSSMGNGFTFELESMLFYALAKATCYLNGSKGRVLVYGDDIIVPVTAAGLLAKVFAWFGFKVNTKKSFWRGSFRESCGKHYYAGYDVTPFYIRRPVCTQRDLILVLNQFRLWATSGFLSMQWLSPEVFNFWEKYSREVPRFLYGGKDVYANSSLVTTDVPRKRIATKMREVEADQDGAYIHWLHTSEACREAFFTSSGTTETGKLSLARNRDWAWHLPTDLCWWKEMGVTPLWVD